MKTKHFLILLLYLCGISLFAKGQDNVKNLFYCNTSYDIDNLWFINENLAFGVNKEEGAIVLIKNGLIVDSLFMGEIYAKDRKAWLYKHLQDIIQIDASNYILVYFGSFSFPIQVQNDSIIHHKIPKTKLSLGSEVEMNFPHLLLHGIGNIDSLLVGYKREKVHKGKASEGISKDDEENFPEFWVARIEENQVNTIKMINSKEKIRTKDLFIDIEDWSLVPLRPHSFQKFYSFHQNCLFFNIVRANKCYVYDIQKDSIWYFDFPPIRKNESCFYYYDYIAQESYVVKKVDTKEYEVYLLSNDFKKTNLVKIIDFFPHKIVNGKIHQITEEREKGKRFKIEQFLLGYRILSQR